MADNTVKIEVNGTELEARPGEMLIAVTDRAGVYVPRFCYHEKLSIAANCRMCLVEVVNAPKPMPACATPVVPGMKVFTRSAKAIGAQRATMEFLLINHPLDCPICDQGGECELQDLAMGFGRDIARFAERKRVVRDKDIGPLVSTDMTRCIHCTRCVRFGQEIAGIQELGTIGRGDRMEISTYVEKSVDHELSGNIIDLCPVGALNNKPYRFTARAWEMRALPAISPHDCLGSNMSAHVLLGRVRRVVPRVNEAINETWLSDRDRFSYEGIYAPDRLEQPMLRSGDEWRTVGWEEALQTVAGALRDAAPTPAGVGAWVSPSATVEEGYLLQKLLRHLGSGSIDHRLRRRDFRDEVNDPVAPLLGVPIAEVQECDAIVVVGSRLRHEVPLLAHRVRKAALAGAAVSFVNPSPGDWLFPVAAEIIAGPDIVDGLRQAIAAGKLRASLAAARRPLILLGLLAARHPRFAEIRHHAAALAADTGARLGYISEGANAAGLSLAGCLPHRGPGGRPASIAGRNAAAMLANPPAALLLLNVEPEHDAAGTPDPRTGFVVALSPYQSADLRRRAHAILPVGTFAETAGTYVNAGGTWQSFAGVASPVGGSRPAWKVLRVLGNLLEAPGFAQESAAAVLEDARRDIAEPAADPPLTRDAPGQAAPPEVALAEPDVPIYQVDSVVRRATSLQQTSFAVGEPLLRDIA
jgi:NADH-quinone oxidoreductase subunit G